jgi:hypothetical protein
LTRKRRRQARDEAHSPRLRKPLLRIIAGLALAGAWAIGGGHARWLAIVIAIVVLGNAVAWF